MKKIKFVGHSLHDLKAFPLEAKREAGFQLDKVQNGLEPSDFKTMKSIGAGVQEIRIRESSGIYRVIYVAKFAQTVFVLHAFQKKTKKPVSLTWQQPKEPINKWKRHKNYEQHTNI